MSAYKQINEATIRKVVALHNLVKKCSREGNWFPAGDALEMVELGIIESYIGDGDSTYPCGASTNAGECKCKICTKMLGYMEDLGMLFKPVIESEPIPNLGVAIDAILNLNESVTFRIIGKDGSLNPIIIDKDYIEFTIKGTGQVGGFMDLVSELLCKMDMAFDEGDEI